MITTGDNDVETVTNRVTIYHNTQCSNSRGALRILLEWGLTPRIVDYRASPPDAAMLSELMHAYDGAPSDFVRFKEPAAMSSGLTLESDPETIADAIVANPMLLQRPVIVLFGRVRIGRPPESLIPALSDAGLSRSTEA